MSAKPLTWLAEKWGWPPQKRHWGIRGIGQSGQVIIKVEVGEPGLQSNSSNLHEP